MVVGTILVNIGVTMTMMVSRLSRPLMIPMTMNSLGASMVVAYTRISIARFSLTLVKPIREVTITKKSITIISNITISSISRPLFIFMINFISIGAMVVWTIMVVSRLSRPLMISISLNSLWTSVVVAYTRISISRFCRPLVISTIAPITSSKSLCGSVDVAVTTISIARFS